MSLYTSLEPDNKYGPVFEQQLAGVRVALRPLSLPDDWPTIGKWLQRAFGRRLPSAAHLPDKHLRETFSIMLQCDFAQPFVGLINDQPAFLVEICDGDKQCDELDTGAHIFVTGDHTIRLVLSHPVIHTRYWSEYALFSCLTYFFSHDQVKRIVWQLHEKDKFYISLANQLGFIPCDAYDRPFDTSTFHQRRTRASAGHAQGAGIQVYLYLRENFARFLTSYHPQMKKLM